MTEQETQHIRDAFYRLRLQMSLVVSEDKWPEARAILSRAQERCIGPDEEPRTKPGS